MALYDPLKAATDPAKRKMGRTLYAFHYLQGGVRQVKDMICEDGAGPAHVQFYAAHPHEDLLVFQTQTLGSIMERPKPAIEKEPTPAYETQTS